MLSKLKTEKDYLNDSMALFVAHLRCQELNLKPKIRHSCLVLLTHQPLVTSQVPQVVWGKTLTITERLPNLLSPGRLQALYRAFTRLFSWYTHFLKKIRTPCFWAEAECSLISILWISTSNVLKTFWNILVSIGCTFVSFHSYKPTVVLSPHCRRCATYEHKTRNKLVPWSCAVPKIKFFAFP